MPFTSTHNGLAWRLILTAWSLLKPDLLQAASARSSSGTWQQASQEAPCQSQPPIRHTPYRAATRLSYLTSRASSTCWKPTRASQGMAGAQPNQWASCWTQGCKARGAAGEGLQRQVACQNAAGPMPAVVNMMLGTQDLPPPTHRPSLPTLHRALQPVAAAMALGTQDLPFRPAVNPTRLVAPSGQILKGRQSLPAMGAQNSPPGPSGKPTGAAAPPGRSVQRPRPSPVAKIKGTSKSGAAEHCCSAAPAAAELANPYRWAHRSPGALSLWRSWLDHVGLGVQQQDRPSLIKACQSRMSAA